MISFFLRYITDPDIGDRLNFEILSHGGHSAQQYRQIIGDTRPEARR